MGRENEKLTILIADDSEINRTLFTEMLAQRGWVAKAVSDGKEVVEIASIEKFDIILMDVQMPVMDGKQAVAILREREKSSGQHVPILALTAHTFIHEKEELRAAGMDDIVPKGVNAEELYRIIESYVWPETGRKAPSEGPRKEAQPMVLDKKWIQEELGIDEATLAELFRGYLEETRLSLAKLDQAIATDNFEMAAALAHSIKGLSGNLRIMKIHEIARAIEMAAKGSRDMKAIREAMAHLKSQLEGFAAVLNP